MVATRTFESRFKEVEVRERIRKDDKGGLFSVFWH